MLFGSDSWLFADKLNAVEVYQKSEIAAQKPSMVDSFSGRFIIKIIFAI